MTRKKVKLAFIANDSARKATYKKRKRGLLKKVSELSTLCDVEACAVIYSPYDAAPEVYPSPLGAQRVLSRFRRMPEMDQSKKMVNQDSFLRQRISKAIDQVKKLRKDNHDKELTRIMHQGLAAAGAAGGPGAARVLQGLTVSELTDLGWIIDENLKEIAKKLEKVRGKIKREATERQAAEEEEKKAVLMVAAGEGSSNGAAAAIGKKVRSFRSHREAEAAAAAAAVEEEKVATEAAMEKKRQWLMDLMMNMNKFNNNQQQEHHDHQMMNFTFGESSGQWANNGLYP